MHPYEQQISCEMNQIAGKDIYNNIHDIYSLDSEKTKLIIKLLLEYACCGQNHLPIKIARELLSVLDSKWLMNYICNLAINCLDLNDEWEYLRLLELSELISVELLKWALSLSENSENPDIIEAADDFKLKLKD